MEGIEKTSYKYNNNFKNPITYYIQTKTITTSLNYKDALEIAYAVIDSLGGDCDFLEDLVYEYENKEEKDESTGTSDYDKMVEDNIAWQNMKL